MRYTSSGGNSAKRWRSAIDSLEEWSKALARWEFVCRDAFDLLGDVDDQPDHGLYLDPPWPDAGDAYVHRFSERDHRELHARLCRFSKIRIVVRYGDHPLIRELYGRGPFSVVPIIGADQANGEPTELLIHARCPLGVD